MLKALSLIKKYEGCRLSAYQDAVGIWTIGYGTTRIHDRAVVPSDILTLTECNQYLLEHVEVITRQIKKAVEVEITENELQALVSFVYNIGIGNFRRSTLLLLLNQRAPAKIVALEFHKWNRAGSKVLAGLITRRKDEADLFLEVDNASE